MAVVAGLAFSAAAGPVEQHTGKSAPARPTAVRPTPVLQDGGPFSDDFDSYANGTPIAGNNGWVLWDGGTAALNATVDNTLAASAPNSLVSVVETDVVQPLNITSGQWRVRAKTYTPSGTTGIGYFIMLNTYSYPYVSGGNWSIQVNLDGNTGIVTSFNRSTANGGPGNTTLPLITDEWVEIVVDIDLDNDTFTMTYGGQPLVSSNGQWSWNTSATPGQVAIQALDLYSQMNGFRWDDIVIEQVGGGGGCYANCDGSSAVPFLNVNDFICFQSAFAAGDSYANCDGSTTAPVLNVNDFICFQSAFAAGCSAP